MDSHIINASGKGCRSPLAMIGVSSSPLKSRSTPMEERCHRPEICQGVERMRKDVTAQAGEARGTPQQVRPRGQDGERQPQQSSL